MRVLKREEREDYFLETFAFDNGAGEEVRGYGFYPLHASAATPAPAILYCHWHGDQYDIGKEELFKIRDIDCAPGPELARRGYVVIGIDAPCFGERQGHGPDGDQATGKEGELSAAKFHLWFGRCLWGMLLRDDLMALDYLCSRPEVDAARIGVTGISMGSTRAWWLMALDERIKTAVCVACMTRNEELIRAGSLHEHGIYYFVPGMLSHFDSEAVIALAAPRPLLFLTGTEDAGSPLAGVEKITQVVSRVYELHGEAARAGFESVLYPGVGHEYTPEMWAKALRWLERWL